MEEETITISKQEYASLRESQLMLEALEEAGVDNWEWYGDAMQLFERNSKK